MSYFSIETDDNRPEDADEETKSPEEGRKALSSLLAELRACEPALKDMALNGHCDAFALALYDFLKTKHHEDPELVVISRERYAEGGKDDGKLMESCALSHVVVEWNGESWDIDGAGAAERWEDTWAQPEEDEEAVDVFDFTVEDESCISALRRMADGRNIDENVKSLVHFLLVQRSEKAAMRELPNHHRARCEWLDRRVFGGIKHVKKMLASTQQGRTGDEAAQLLLKHRTADLLWFDPDDHGKGELVAGGVSAFMVDVWRDVRSPLAQWLYDHGADPGRRNRAGLSPLMSRARDLSTDSLQNMFTFLERYNPDPHTPEEDQPDPYEMSNDPPGYLNPPVYLRKFIDSIQAILRWRHTQNGAPAKLFAQDDFIHLKALGEHLSLCHRAKDIICWLGGRNDEMSRIMVAKRSRDLLLKAKDEGAAMNSGDDKPAKAVANESSGAGAGVAEVSLGAQTSEARETPEVSNRPLKRKL